LKCLHLAFELPLGHGQRGVVGRHFGMLVPEFGEFALSAATASLGLVEQLAGFLKFTVHLVATTLSHSILLASFFTGTLLLLKLGLGILQVLLVPLDRL